jgi:hypothetical protein
VAEKAHLLDVAMQKSKCGKQHYEASGKRKFIYLHSKPSVRNTPAFRYAETDERGRHTKKRL